ncbi:hypothetical protein H2198_009049 [Neophaeococcomyces mojaviensis]|uniref:Uncharacterized protein n=1 Tax=Neophaeococcomyces mojaviensis TaxID=3383035 RepID=A0ACC2ZVQ7_9EURO|nr:hypothetical protein H2198_009049 [Knufia sp. JES_112]
MALYAVASTTDFEYTFFWEDIERFLKAVLKMVLGRLGEYLESSVRKSSVGLRSGEYGGRWASLDPADDDALSIISNDPDSGYSYNASGVVR